jgi:hypothetical protein
MGDPFTLYVNIKTCFRFRFFLQTGKVEVGCLFLTENQTGGVRSDGSCVYLQFR